MSKDMRPYIVRQGDYLAKLAFVHGFDAEEVWNDPKNEDLRRIRPDPNILAPDDILYLPAPKKTAISIEKGSTNTYSATIAKVDVRLRLDDENGPVVGEAYEISVGEGIIQGTTDETGMASFSVPVLTRELRLRLPARQREFSLRIGDMDPASELIGVQKRLVHRGYYHGRHYGTYDASARQSIEAFQRDQSLEVTGELDSATRDRLCKEHGC